MEKIKFIEVNYHCHKNMSDREAVIKKHLPSNLFIQPLKKHADITLVKHMNYEGELVISEIRYCFKKRSNHFLQIPFTAHSYISEIKPDLLLVQGFIFPLQVMALRKKLGKKAVVVLQHHGELPAGKKKIFQKLADRSIDGYTFSAIGNAQPWLDANIISDPDKCFEMPSASTHFKKLDKEKSKKITGMKSSLNFLWVGRLDNNKDPLTVLKAFLKYRIQQGIGQLHMIFSETGLLNQVRKFIDEHEELRQSVFLIGKIQNAEIENWLNAADYYISASYHEGGSYALTEAMACGCIPIVSSIPPAMKAIDNGRYGFFFQPGNDEELSKRMLDTDRSRNDELSAAVIQQFKNGYSPEAIADRLLFIYNKLRSK